MIEKDLILRLIEEVVRTLARALRLRQEGRDEEADQALERALEDLTGFGPEALIAMGPAAIVALASPQGALEVERLAWTGRLLEEHGVSQERRGNAKAARAAYLAAFSVYDELDQRGLLQELRGDDAATHRQALSRLVERLES